MNLLHPTPRFNPRVRRFCGPRSPPSIRWAAARISIRSSSLPFSPEKAKHYKELEAAVDVVQRACHLCVDVKGSLLSGDRRILEKNDRTPVTVADFGVQALISLELGRLFPSIPMVAEEDSAVLRLNSVNYEQNADDSQNFLLDAVYSAVADKANPGEKLLSSDDVLESIDRGGRDAVCFEAKPATYWVLDPIDGTRGFLKGDEALYVVGLALVVEGEIVLGVMGCPNWKEDISLTDDPVMEGPEERVSVFGQGTIMMSHAGCGTWRRGFPDMLGSVAGVHDGWPV
ncbi:hypothetical protein QJS10_CPB21g00754 [Acorus calamus]|uniref:PAP-specific phosphatase, mitochondrial n=1 Tax=Acorus calamus TaxID=4465 RepID=A0AAV9C1N0_ACOCL|nr:hypothetical protein QJS10_CPB21g00754 [Acorus calamus]